METTISYFEVSGLAGLGFGVWGLGCKVLGFRGWAFGFSVSSSKLLSLLETSHINT